MERPYGSFFLQAEDGIRDYKVTGVQTCALPISYGLESTKRSEQSVGTPPGSGRPGPGRAPEELAAPARVAAATRRPGRGQWLAVSDGGPGGARAVAVGRRLLGGAGRAPDHPTPPAGRRRGRTPGGLGPA